MISVLVNIEDTGPFGTIKVRWRDIYLCYDARNWIYNAIDMRIKSVAGTQETF